MTKAKNKFSPAGDGMNEKKGMLRLRRRMFSGFRFFFLDVFPADWFIVVQIFKNFLFYLFQLEGSQILTISGEKKPACFF